MSLLERMPPEVLETILSFVSNVQDFRNCELCCKTLNKIIAKDATWCHCKTLFQHDPRLSTYREKSCVHFALLQVSKWQKNPSNILVKGTGTLYWKCLIVSVLQRFFLNSRHHHNHCTLRGDTLGTLMEILQAALLDQLQRANYMVCANQTDDDAYPLVTRRHFETLYALQGPLINGIFRNLPTYFEEAVELARTQIPKVDRDGMVRRLAYRAGIVRIANDVYDYLWGYTVCLILDLFQPGMERLIHNKRIGGRRLLEGTESMATVPPYCEYLDYCLCGLPIYEHTPVPKQIEEAALALSIPSKVYGDVWLTSHGRTEEEEREEAWSRYMMEWEEETERAAKRKFEEIDSSEDTDSLSD